MDKSHLDTLVTQNANAALHFRAREQRETQAQAFRRTVKAMVKVMYAGSDTSEPNAIDAVRKSLRGYLDGETEWRLHYLEAFATAVQFGVHELMSETFTPGNRAPEFDDVMLFARALEKAGRDPRSASATRRLFMQLRDVLESQDKLEMVSEVIARLLEAPTRRDAGAEIFHFLEGFRWPR